MPRVISKVLRKTAKQEMVYWEKTASSDTGRPTFKDPIEVKCRWEDMEQETIVAGGRTVIARSYIMTGTKLRDGSIAMLGLLTDWQALPTYPNIPTYNQGGREILRVKGTPDLTGLESLYEAWTS